MRCAYRLVVPRCRGVGDGFDGGPSALRVFGENRWPWVSGYFFLAGQEVGFSLVLSMVRVRRLFLAVYGFWICYSFFGYLYIQQP